MVLSTYLTTVVAYRIGKQGEFFILKKKKIVHIHSSIVHGVLVGAPFHLDEN
jgi:hypothetical protein